MTEQGLLHRCATQHGVFTVHQARDEGINRQLVHRWARRGRVRRLRTGVYALAGAPTTWEQAVVAAVLAAGSDAVASHRTAMALHGIEPARRDASTPLEVSVPAGRDARPAGVVVHRVLLPERHTTLVEGIPVTSYERTLLDSAATLGFGQLARGLDQGLVTQRATLATASGTCTVLRPAPGRRRARLVRLLDERAPESERAGSGAEIRVLRAIRRAGLPAPVPQFPVVVDGREFFLDAAYPEHRIGLEYQGWDPHRSRSAFDADHRRDRLLTVAGWTVLYFTSASTDDEIVASIERLRNQSPPR